MLMKKYRISFGHIEIGDIGRQYLDKALACNWVSEGQNVQLFETAFSKRLGTVTRLP